MPTIARVGKSQCRIGKSAKKSDFESFKEIFQCWKALARALEKQLRRDFRTDGKPLGRIVWSLYPLEKCGDAKKRNCATATIIWKDKNKRLVSGMFYVNISPHAVEKDNIKSYVRLLASTLIRRRKADIADR